MSDGDIMPNKVLHKRRLEVRLSEMKLNLERMDLRLLELDDEKIKIEANKTATKRTIDELQKEIGGI